MPYQNSNTRKETFVIISSRVITFSLLLCVDVIQLYFSLTRYFRRRRQWHPTPVLLTGKSHGWRSLVGWSPWGCTESDTTERLHFHFSLSCFGEGNGNPLQCSCLENPRDGGAWWAAVYGVAQSQTRLKQLSSSSSSSRELLWEFCQYLRKIGLTPSQNQFSRQKEILYLKYNKQFLEQLEWDYFSGVQ